MKHLYELKISKDATFSKILSKCIKDIFAKKNQGNVAGVKENLQALVHLPQQFGDHAKCFQDFVPIRGHTTRHIHTEANQTNQHLKTAF